MQIPCLALHEASARRITQVLSGQMRDSDCTPVGHHRVDETVFVHDGYLKVCAIPMQAKHANQNRVMLPLGN